MADFVRKINPKKNKPDQNKPEENKPEENIKKDVKEEVKQENICMVGITNNTPYDSSELPNNATTFYTTMNYSEFRDFSKIVCFESETTNMKFKNIINYIKDPDTRVFFDFKCCSDCHSGSTIQDEHTMKIVYKFINYVTDKGCNIVVGDHSMAAIFNNWDASRLMYYRSPIQIETQTTSGPYKMTGLKQDFINSIHPVLKNLGDMSSEDKIDIEFINMSGTKIYNIIPKALSKVKVISKGKELRNTRYYPDDMDTVVNKDQKDQKDQKDREDNLKPVHCELTYKKGKIIVSATHWCNLTTVNSKVDVNILREKYFMQYGNQATAEFDAQYDSAVKSGCTNTVNRVISDSVKYVCSNVSTPYTQTKSTKSPNQNTAIQNIPNPNTPLALKISALNNCDNCDNCDNLEQDQTINKNYKPKKSYYNH